MAPDKSQPYENFGRLLTEGIKQIDPHKSLVVVQEELAANLGYSIGMIYLWRRGEHLPDPHLVEEMVRIFVRAWRADQQWVRQFLEKGRYGSAQAIEALITELYGDQPSIQSGPSIEATPPESPPLALTDSAGMQVDGVRFLLEALQGWSESFFQWSAMSDQRRASWAGRVLHGLIVLTDQLSARGVLIIGVSLLLWWITAQLVIPILQWPLIGPNGRALATLSYGLATILIPLLVAAVTPPEQIELFPLSTTRRRLIFWALKLTGALIGFWFFSVGVISLVLLLYYLRLEILSDQICALLAAVPLFFSYVVARRMPFDRRQTLESDPSLDSADRLFLGGLLVLGPLTAFFLFIAYPFLTDRTFAPLVLVLIFTGLALWEYRKYARQVISDPALILVIGAVPLTVILVYISYLMAGLSWLSSLGPIGGILPIYMYAWSFYLATLLVRRQIKITLPGAVGALVLELAASLLIRADGLLGIAFVVGIVLLWLLWGQKRWQVYLMVHPSLWLMILVTVGGLALAGGGQIPGWLNGISLAVVVGLLIVWVYRTPEASVPPLPII